MKFLNWLFSFTSRHRWDINRYQKNKVATRVIVIILELVLLISSWALELWCIDLFNKQFTLGLLELIFLLIPIVMVTIDTNTLYIYLGFKTFISKKIDKAIEKQDPSVLESADSKCGSGLDLFVGIFSILCLVLLIAGLIILPSLNK